ncbi:olfactory receptor 6B2 [Otolemur garnettii]|uniref:olfactory receptor 6B2 n=1 Tax=Otolemur garnettii TaxID=30611 RepID=UPI000C7F4EE1|nr:olfactory receptor 6B2 [Otolemur garnettii]
MCCRPATPQHRAMRGENITKVSTFVLLGFPTTPELQYVLFLLLLLAYLFILVENLAIILTVWASPSLHRPMYYFLSSMSSLEIWYVCDIMPKMLDGLLLQRKRISFVGCMTQLYFFSSLVCTECVLLASMAYDRYVAICHPLRYHVIMTTLLATVLSYGHITLAVLHIPSAAGRWRAFSTCASHLTVVTIFYMAMIFMYVRPQAIDTRSSNKLISAVYTVLTPILNPLIYCLRNKEFKDALKKALGWGQTSQNN